MIPTTATSRASRRARQRRWIVLIAAGGAPIVLALLILWLGHASPAAVDTPAGSPAESAFELPLATHVEAGELPRATPVAAASPLADALPEDIPVPELIEQFDARARRGDAAAACRIVAELERCRMIGSWNERSTDREIERLARQDLDELTLAARSRELAEVAAYNAQAKRHCEGVTPAQAAQQIPHYLLAAARAGHTPSMVQFAAGHRFDVATLVADPQLYADYRTHAWPLFLRAFQAGDPTAAMLWLTVMPSSMGQSPLTGLMPEEWQTSGVAVALAMRIQRELAPGAPAQEMSEPPSGTDHAQADRLFDRHFARSPHLDSWRAIAAQGERRGNHTPRYEAQTQLCTVGLD